MRPSSRDVACLLEILTALRTPGSGCPWDLEQNFASIAPYTIEEAYEVADAIDRNDLVDLCDELGDLLLQVVFHAQMAREIGAFEFGDVVESITAKLLRRHPHVFGDARDLSPAEVSALWGTIKQAEKQQRRAERGGTVEPAEGVLSGVPVTLPALTRAEKLSSRAAAIGFDWPDVRQVLDKVREETAEVAEALLRGSKKDVASEIGDLLFAAVNLARHTGTDAETALRGANAKFERRFRTVERGLAGQGKTFEVATFAEMEQLWAAAKDAERGSDPD